MHRWERTLPVRGMRRAMTRAFTRQMAVPQRADVVHNWEHLTARKCHKGGGRTGARELEDERK